MEAEYSAGSGYFAADLGSDFVEHVCVEGPYRSRVRVWKSRVESQTLR